MSKIVIILGDSGSGKTASMRNLPEGSAVVMSATGKEFSFVNKNKIKMAKVGYAEILKTIPVVKEPVVVIDDANYLIMFEYLNAQVEGIPDKEMWNKYREIAIHFYEIIDCIMKKNSDQIFYIMSHASVNEDTKQRQIKSVGKMLPNIGMEGLTNTVLETKYDDLDGYVFITQRENTASAAKSPMGMFTEKQIPNDLYEVDKQIRQFYGFAPITIKKETTTK